MRYDVKRKDLAVKRAIAPVEVPTLDSHLCFALYAASNHMTRLFVPFLQKLGVTYPQYLVLVVLWERGPQGVGELASLLGMDFGTLSPMLKRIESKGLVTRQRPLSDVHRHVRRRMELKKSVASSEVEPRKQKTKRPRQFQVQTKPLSGGTVKRLFVFRPDPGDTARLLDYSV